MATLFKSKKKTKPKIIEIKDLTEETDNENTVSENNENTKLLSDNKNKDCVINVDASPSAPPEHSLPVYRPTGLADNQIRTQFMAKVYSVIFFQKMSIMGLVALFTLIPHLKQVVRKGIFDPLFMKGWIGFPLFIVPLIVMTIFPKLRRHFAIWTFTILTICLSLLISYAVSSPKIGNSFLYSMGFSNATDFGIIMASKKKIDFTKWRYICIVPAVMIGSSILSPTILRYSLNNTIWPSIGMTFLSTYLAANTVPVIRHNDLEITEKEHVFAAIQLYLNPERGIRSKLKQWFWPTNRHRDSYAPIGV